MGRSKIQPAHPITGSGNRGRVLWAGGQPPSVFRSSSITHRPFPIAHCVLLGTIIAGQFVIVLGIHTGELIAEWHGVFASRRREHQTFQQQAKFNRLRTAYRGIGQGPLVTLRTSAHDRQTYTPHKTRSITDRPMNRELLPHVYPAPSWALFAFFVSTSHPSCYAAPCWTTS